MQLQKLKNLKLHRNANEVRVALQDIKESILKTQLLPQKVETRYNLLDLCCKAARARATLGEIRYIYA